MLCYISLKKNMVIWNPSKIPWGLLASSFVFLLMNWRMRRRVCLLSCGAEQPVLPAVAHTVQCILQIFLLNSGGMRQAFESVPDRSLCVGGTEGGAVASNPSHQGAAQWKLSSNIDSAAESNWKEPGARLICRTPDLWGRERDGKKGL